MHHDLDGRSLGGPRRHFRVVDSTNRVARELAAGGARHGTLVTAAEQSAGRGRQGRTWSAVAGRSLLMSLVIREPSPVLSLAAGVAVAQTVDAVMMEPGTGTMVELASGPTSAGGRAARIAPQRAQLKWPNDVMLDGRKVAGILVEGRPQQRWAVLGIGLNVAIDLAALPPEVRDRAGTLGLPAAAVEPVLTRLLTELDRWLAAPDGAVLSALAQRDYLRGRELHWQTAAGEAHGTALGIGADGGLMARLPNGSVTTIEAGEVHIGAV